MRGGLTYHSACLHSRGGLGWTLVAIRPQNILRRGGCPSMSVATYHSLAVSS
jgi:hypothetical protein